MDANFETSEFFTFPAHILGSNRPQPGAFPTPIKLRDSCDACAASKLRCPKEKPACSRCAKKKIPCKYVATKRAGRKHDHRPNNTSNDGMNIMSMSQGSGTELMGRMTGMLAWPGIAPPTGEGGDFFATSNSLAPSSKPQASPDPLGLNTTSESYSNLLSSGDSMLLSNLTDLDTDFDNLFGSPLSFSVQEPQEKNQELNEKAYEGTHFFSSLDSRTSPVNNGAFDRNDESSHAGSNSARFFNQQSPQDGNDDDTIRLDHSRENESPQHSCLKRVLGLLGHLFPVVCDGVGEKRRYPTIQTVIAENEAALSAIREVLQCDCSEDGYLLVTVALILFKIMGWYAAAVGRSPSTESDTESITSRSQRSSSVHSEQVYRRPEVVRSYNIEGKDSDRMAAQLVLSELHRVQRLVTSLSEKLKAKTESEGTVTPISMVSPQTGGSMAGAPMPFSTDMIHQLEVDLRKRIRSLSLDIVETLKCES